MSSAIDQFRSAIVGAGLVPPDEIHDDGLLHRFSTSGKRQDLSGWYCLHSDGVPAGAFGCWRSGLQSNWCAKSADTMTLAEREAHRKRVADIQAQREQALLQRQEDAATTAAARWAQATLVDDHPYLVRKGIKPHGVRAFGESLLVPLRDAGAQLHSLQSIAPDGTKRFQSGGRIRGCYHSIGKPAGVLVIAEGFATGASIHEATGHAVACAMNAGNLLEVAQVLRGKYPKLEIIVAADDDHITEGNPGLTKATEAAKAVGGKLAVPVFGPDRPEGATDFNDLHHLAGADAVRQCFDQASAADEAWPELREIKADLPPVPAFDAEVLLPPVLADFVLDEADRMPCAPDFVGAALLVALGSAIGARCALKPKRLDDWLVPPNLWGGVVGLPSQKKTPATSAAMRFLDRLEVKAAEELEEEKKFHAAEMAAFEAQESAIKAAMKTAVKDRDNPGKMDAAMADLRSLQAPEEPHARRFKCSDSTVPKLGEILSRNPAGLLVFRDELIGLLSSFDREGHEGDRAFYLEGFNGTGSFSIDRIGRGELKVPNLCLSVFGGIQPDLLERYLSEIVHRLNNDGLVQRFQVLVYPDPVAWEWRDRRPVQGVREAVRDLFGHLASFDPIQDGAAPADDFAKLPHFSFDDAAQELFIEWSHELHHELIANEDNPMMAQHLGKFEKLFCAVALILHLADGRTGPVQEDSALRAAAWCEYLAGHARRIYASVETARVNTAKTLARHIASGKLPDDFTVRDVWKKGWGGLKTAAEAEAALAVLEEHGHLRSHEASEGTGRPTTRYQINPKLRGAS